MEIILISARDLHNPIMFSKSKAYAVAWISNDLKNRQWTPEDEENGTNPTWNQVMNFTLDEAALQQGRLLLEIEIYTDSTFGEKEIGRVSVPLNEFLKPAGSNKGVSDSAQFVSYQVRKPGGKGKGALNLSIKLAENVDFKQQQQHQQQPVEAVTRSFVPTEAEPVVAYPVNPSAGSSSESPPYSPDTNQYPPPSYPPQAGYPPPPPDHQGYPPPHYQGYPPPPPHQQGYPPPPPPPNHQGYPPPPPPPHHQGHFPPPPPPHHQGHFPPPPPPHYQGHFPPPPPPHHRGYPLY